MTFTADLKADATSVAVYPRTFEKFMDVVRPATIVTTKGRSIHVRRSGGVFPSFGELAADLLGWGMPCDEFRVDGSNLYARLKTIAQVVADNFAGEVDDAFGEFSLEDASSGVNTQCFANLDDNMSTKHVLAKRHKRPKDNALVVLEHMEQCHIDEVIEVDEVYEEIGRKVEAPRAGRRREYFERAVAQLVETKWLKRHSEDRVALF